MVEINSQLQNNERNVMVLYRVLLVLSSEVGHGGLLVLLLYVKYTSMFLEICIRLFTFSRLSNQTCQF